MIDQITRFMVKHVSRIDAFLLGFLSMLTIAIVMARHFGC